MSCIVMYQPYPPSSYLLPPTGPPPGPSNHSSHHQLPSLSSGGFDRGLPSTTNSSQLTSAAVVATTSPVISPHSPATQQQQHPRLPPSTNNNGLVQQNSIIEPKLEKNLEINPQSCDAYGQMMFRVSETAAEITPPPQSSSRPDSGHPHLQERRDSYEAAAGAASSEAIKTNNPTTTSISDKGNAQYVAENQCLVKYYEGDAAIAVEEHFNRTLKESNEQQETSTPMNQRNLPPSFWHENLPQTNVNGSNNSSSNTTTTSASAVSTASWASEFYNDQLQQAAALHQLAADWPYTAAGHSAAAQSAGYVNRSAVSSHPYNYTRFHQPASAAATAAGSNWAWAAASRLAAGQVKGEMAGDYQAYAAAALAQGATAAAHHYGATGLHNATAGDFSHHYTNMTGLETSMQESTKDLYWPASSF